MKKFPKCYISNCKGATTIKEIVKNGIGHLAYVCMGCDICLGYLPEEELIYWKSWDPEEFLAEQQVIKMSPSELALVPHDIRRWSCHVEGCNNGTRIRDYGFTVNPWYVNTRWGWLNLTGYVYTCGKHKKAESFNGKLIYKPGSGFDHLTNW